MSMYENFPRPQAVSPESAGGESKLEKSRSRYANALLKVKQQFSELGMKVPAFLENTASSVVSEMVKVDQATGRDVVEYVKSYIALHLTGLAGKQ